MYNENYKILVVIHNLEGVSSQVISFYERTKAESAFEILQNNGYTALALWDVKQ